MFGTWRTLLAIEVVAFHLLFLPFIGAYAVFSFFVLSGFLMTAIVHLTYGYSTRGFVHYLGNRALRLYPDYWFAALIALALIAIFGASTVQHHHQAMTVPATSAGWVQNVSMIFPAIVPRDIMPRLVPLAWALTVEIVHYVLIGMGISRTKRSTWLWLIASVGYTLAAGSIHHPRDDLNEIIPIYQYSAIPAASLPFSFGALVWHYRSEIQGLMSQFRIGLPAVLIIGRWLLYCGIVILFAVVRWAPLVMIGNWINIALSGLIICALFHARSSDRVRDIDRHIGDFSYPIYLLHMPMALVAMIMLYGEPVKGRNFAVFALGLAVTVAISMVCTRIIDPAAERLRRHIKQTV